MEKLGFIISSTNNFFDFLIEKEVKINEYVISDSNIFGRVIGIENWNPLLNDEIVLRFREDLLSFMSKNDNLEVATVRVLGKLDKEMVTNAYVPPKPMEDVKRLTLERLEKILGVRQDIDGIHIGNILPYNHPIKIDPYQLIEKHFGVLAMSGAGKSNLISLILKEFAQKDLGIRVVVLDMHNEYYKFARKFPTKYISIDSSDIRLPNEHLNKYILNLEEFSEKQKQYLNNAFKDLSNRYSPSINDLIEYFNKKDDSTARAISWRLEKIKEYGIFAESVESNLFNKIDLLRSRSLIINFSDSYQNENLMVIRAYGLLEELLKYRKGLGSIGNNPRIPPVLVIVEEAHLLASNEAIENSLTQGVLTRIAREGRKFGLCLGIVSQRPHYLNQTVMAQLNVQIFLRMVNPNDLDYIKNVSEYLDQTDINSIPDLMPGQAIVAGLYKYPLFMQFNLIDQELKAGYNSLKQMSEEWNYKNNNDYQYYQED